MGEYATVIATGEEIKIGTCEEMLYLRYEQRHLVRKLGGSLDPTNARTLAEIRFRFPWPDEDNRGPGEFDDPFRQLAVHVPPPAEIDHYTVQFASNHPKGYLVSLPCPEGPDQIEGVTIHRNGFPGPTYIVGQGLRDGVLATMMRCACGRTYRLPTLLDAEPVIAQLLDRAERERRIDNHHSAANLIEIARRVRVGYQAVG